MTCLKQKIQGCYSWIIPAIPKAGRFSFWEFSSTSHPHQHNPFRRAGQSPSLLEFASLKSPRVTPAAGKMQGIGIGVWSLEISSSLIAWVGSKNQHLNQNCQNSEKKLPQNPGNAVP